MTLLDSSRLCAALKPERDADRSLYDAIVQETRNYRQREVRALGYKEIKDDHSNAETKGRRARKWLDAIKGLMEDEGLVFFANDFEERFCAAFFFQRKTWNGWNDTLKGAQAWLPTAVLQETFRDLQAAHKDQCKAILFARTPYLLYERMAKIWQETQKQQGNSASVQHTLAFPSEFFQLYPERVELAGTVNNTPPAEWPAAATIDPIDGTPADLTAAWEHLAHVLVASIAAGRTEKAMVQEEFDDFLRHESVLCLKAFRSAQSHGWFLTATPRARALFASSVAKIRETAHRAGREWGALFAIRHLIAVLGNANTSPFPGSKRAGSGTLTTYTRVAASLAHGGEIGLRAGVRYGRWSKYW